MNSSINLGNNKLANNLLEALTKNIDLLAPIFWSLSYGPTSDPTCILPLTLVKYTNKNLQKTTQFALKSFF